MDCESKLDLIEDNPVGIDLSITLRVQHHRLECSKVCQSDLCVFWAIIISIDEGVVVKVILTNITDSVSYKNQTEEQKKLRTDKNSLRSVMYVQLLLSMNKNVTCNVTVTHWFILH